MLLIRARTIPPAIIGLFTLVAPLANGFHPVLTSLPQAFKSFFMDQSLLLVPPKEKASLPPDKHSAVVFLPGCQVKPDQYRGVAEAIQQSSQQAVWIMIPEAPMDMPNPFTVPRLAKAALHQLQSQGYPGNSTFVGGHSLGGVFLPSVLSSSTGLQADQVDGLIQLSAFFSRSLHKDDPALQLPSLTLQGDLDGLVRPSRIAEDVQRHVVDKGNTDEARLHHSVVLVPGMNHFGFVEGQAPRMKRIRDLVAELDQDESIQQVGSIVAAFVDCHKQPSSCDRATLLDKIRETEEYLQPLITALALEGNPQVEPSSGSLFEEDDDEEDSSGMIGRGTPWVERVQRELAPDLSIWGGTYDGIQDQRGECWYFNPLSEPMYYRPKIIVHPGLSRVVTLQSTSEPIHELEDRFFDAGFFSNTAMEIRSKFNSPEAILRKMGAVDGASAEHKVPLGSDMNAKTIAWAFDQAPERVKRRYQERGRQLKVGENIETNSGPGWIWSYLRFRDESGANGERYRYVDSPFLTTSVDHPLAFLGLGGKLYCKLLSPARALDYMYTDSLR